MRLDGHHILRRRALLALDNFEFYLLTLGQGLEALALNRRVMTKDVLLTVVTGDEAKAFFVAKPFHCSGGTQC